MNNQKRIYEFIAQRATMQEPRIEVLDNKLIDQYMMIVRAIDSSFKKKLKNKKLLLPELRKDGNETIAIYSDYGGESPISRYRTYSFLVCGWNHAYAFPEGMEHIRQKFSLGDKEISFKNLKFGPIKRSLREYLSLLDNTVPGILVNVIVDKKIKSFFGNHIPGYVFNELKKAGCDEWKPSITEKVLRIVHTISYLAALLSKDGQKLYWVTDHDAIAANKEKHDTLASLLQSVLTLYTSNQFPIVGYATPFEERDTGQLDFLSCTDLAAGALEHYFTRRKTQGELTIKAEADEILSWLGRDGICLKKHTLLIELQDNGIMAHGEVVFKNDDPSNKSIQIPVRIRYGR